MPSLDPVTTARRPSSRNEGSVPATISFGIRHPSPGAPRGFVERVEIVHQALVERVGGIDVDAVGGDDVVVLKADAANLWISRIGLEVERHSLLQHDGGVLRCGTEV